MNLSMIDRLVREVAPGKYAERMAQKDAGDTFAGGYDATNPTRSRKSHAFSRSMPGIEEKNLPPYDRRRMSLETFDQYRNTPVVRGAVDRFASYSVFKGLEPVPVTSDPAWNALALQWWLDVYSKTCDLRQRVPLNVIQKLTVKARILSGEVFFVLINNGQILPVEADRVATPRKFFQDDQVVDGLRYAKNGIVVGYYVCERSSGGSVNQEKYKYIRANNMIHCMNPWRFDQFRGISDLAPVVGKIQSYADAHTYYLNKIKFEGQLLLKRTTEAGRLAGNEGLRGGYQLEDSAGRKQQVETSEWGQIHNLNKGEDLTDFYGRSPNGQIAPYFKEVLRDISMSLNIPYSVMRLISEDASFSSHKAAMLHAQHTFEEWNDWLNGCLNTRLWQWRIAKAIKEGVLPPAPIDAQGVSQWWRVEWQMPYFKSLDENKQLDADTKKVTLGTGTVTGTLRSQNLRRENVWTDRQAEIEDAIERAENLNEAHPGADVSWRDFTNAGVPGLSAMPSETSKIPTGDEVEEDEDEKGEE